MHQKAEVEKGGNPSKQQKRDKKKKRKMFLIQYLQPTKYETTTVFGGILFSPLYTGRLFHHHMLDNSICHFRGLGLFCHFYFVFDGKFF